METDGESEEKGALQSSRLCIMVRDIFGYARAHPDTHFLLSSFLALRKVTDLTAVSNKNQTNTFHTATHSLTQTCSDTHWLAQVRQAIYQQRETGL